MAAPNLSANVPRGQAFRVVYRLSSPLGSLFGGVDEEITAAWQEAGVTVISPATTPVLGGTTSGFFGIVPGMGPHEAFTSIDGRTSLTQPTMTWDRYLEPLRHPSLGFLLGIGVAVELDSVDLLTPAALSTTTAPVARTAASQTPATTSLTQNPTLAGLVGTATNRLLLAGAIVLAIVVAWKIGPQLMAAMKGRK